MDQRLPVSPSETREMAVRGAMLRSGPVFIIPCQIPGGVAYVLDDLPPGALPRLRFEGPVDGLKAHLRRAVADRLAQPRWLANWLVHDVVEKAEYMVRITGAPALRVRLEVVDDDHCSEFHIDDVRLRLMTTYRGPGTRVGGAEDCGPDRGRDHSASRRHSPTGERPCCGDARRQGGDLNDAWRSAPVTADRRDGRRQTVPGDRRSRAESSLNIVTVGPASGDRSGAFRPAIRLRAITRIVDKKPSPPYMSTCSWMLIDVAER